MVKARHQEALCHVEYLFACDFFYLNGAGQQHTQIQHHLEQQIFRSTVRFYVIHQREQILLADFIRRIVHRLHVAVIQTQAAETGVQISRSSQAGIFLDFTASTADALFADFANVLIASLVRFALFVRLFRQLHHNELAVSAIFSVQLHNGVGGCGRAGKEVEDYCIFLTICHG